jgi:hypothetical protein
LGAEADVTGRPEGLRYGHEAMDPGDLRWLSPLPLWIGIVAGPVIWAIDLTISYALVHWSCSSQRQSVLHALTFGALAIVAGGATVSFMALRHTPAGGSTDGGDPRQRARFMAVLGLASNALFALQILASAIPVWVLDACL